ncbi:MAG: hypothetical protein LBB84_03505 [Tannerellaceae bacterium]|jgi:hypothetical protein|nr:hypothetical protein [Tannerellaceae bacterium]
MKQSSLTRPLDCFTTFAMTGRKTLDCFTTFDDGFFFRYHVPKIWFAQLTLIPQKAPLVAHATQHKSSLITLFGWPIIREREIESVCVLLRELLKKIRVSRHCERSEAIQPPHTRTLDCFTLFAMTGRNTLDCFTTFAG